MPHKREKGTVWPDVLKTPNGYISIKYQSDLVKWIPEDQTFHVGQTYEDEAATTIVCKICGGQEFKVGQGHCLTAIKCPKCEWELVIHEG